MRLDALVISWLSWTGHQSETRPGIHEAGSTTGQQVLKSPNTVTSTAPQNFAAWIETPQAQLTVSPAPYPKCGSSELIIKNYVAAINPVDWKIQTTGGVGFNLQYPVILGEDVAGDVVEVGKNLKAKFFVGQRVMAHTMGLSLGAAHGGFQLYPVLTGATTSEIPDDMSYSDAAVLPLSISTAAAGLFMNASLGLDYPPIEASVQVTKDSPVLLVWGGSSSVGSSVIQLASAAGYKVVTTASSSNFEFCKSLGAAHVVDYHDPEVVPNLIKLIKGKQIVGAYDAIASEDTIRQNAEVLHAFGGGKIASVGQAPDVYEDVTVLRISSGQIVTDEPEIAADIWGVYVPAALKLGKLVPSPEPLVVGSGLESVQKGLNRQKEGVSARKVEVLLI